MSWGENYDRKIALANRVHTFITDTGPPVTQESFDKGYPSVPDMTEQINVIIEQGPQLDQRVVDALFLIRETAGKGDTAKPEHKTRLIELLNEIFDFTSAILKGAPKEVIQLLRKVLKAVARPGART